MLKSTTEFLDLATTEDAKEDEWDEMPALLFLTNEDAKILPIQMDGEHSLYEHLVQLDAMLKFSGHGFDVLGSTTVVLLNEGYAIVQKSREEAEATIAEARSKGVSISERPDSVEVKMFTAVDAEGTESRHHRRGVPGWVTMPGEEGRIIDVLKSIYASVSGNEVRA